MKRTTHRAALSAVLLACVLLPLTGQTSVTFGQQIALLKMLKPDLESIGVLSTSLNEKDVQQYTRSSLQQGVKLYVAEPKDARDIPSLYKKLVAEKKVQLILIPSVEDRIMLDVGYEFLKENTLLDRIGVCVPDVRFIANGAFFSVAKEEGKLVVTVNQRIAALVGASIPSQPNPSISFVTR
ncbi:MAG: hypothetical protein F9K22_01125 [Bacteroidetes bacterium]|nr:MAG: hypothetical protein F9K22_01125 [Bacteroidota bacterium]